MLGEDIESIQQKFVWRKDDIWKKEWFILKILLYAGFVIEILILIKIETIVISSENTEAWPMPRVIFDTRDHNSFQLCFITSVVMMLIYLSKT